LHFILLSLQLCGPLQLLDETVVQAVQEALQETKAEEVEIERRKTNVTVHGVPESDAEVADQRIDDDMILLATMFQEVQAENVTINSIVRLGKKGSRSSTEPETNESCFGFRR